MSALDILLTKMASMEEDPEEAKVETAVNTLLQKLAGDPAQGQPAVNLPQNANNNSADAQAQDQGGDPEEEIFTAGYQQGVQDALSQAMNAVQVAMNTVASQAAGPEASPDKQASAPEETKEAGAVVAPGAGLGRMMGIGMGRATGNYGAALIQALNNLASSTDDEVLKQKIADLISYLSTPKQASAPEQESEQEKIASNKEENMDFNEMVVTYWPAIVKVAAATADLGTEVLKDALSNTKLASEEDLYTILYDTELLDNIATYTEAGMKIASNEEQAVVYQNLTQLFKLASADPLIDYMTRTILISNGISEGEQEVLWNNIEKVAGDIPITPKTLEIANALASLLS